MDCYIGPNKHATKVFVVNQGQMNDPKSFDEHKCMLGFSSLEEAKTTYIAGHTHGEKLLQSIKTLTIPNFKLWLKSHDVSRPI